MLDPVNLFGAVFGVLTFGVLLAEIYLHLAKKRRDYQFADVVTNLQTMFLYQLLGAAALGVIYLCYQWVFEHFRFMEQSISSPWAWIGGFILADFCHYWFHRTSHQNNFLWGIHQGHHTSEDFNLSIAVRKGIFQQWVDWPFFIPMAFLGFPFFEMFLPLKGLQFAYQFWLHNQFIGRLPIIEKILVTPSAHRVHHGQNPQYIDKNHAGVFIIWDKLFGTFAEEKEPVIYGTTEPVNSFHPIGIQFVWWKSLWDDAKQTKRWRDKLAIPFKPTGWRPADVAAQPRANHIADLSNHKPFRTAMSGKLKLYSVLQLLFMGLLISNSAEGTDFLPFSNAVHGFALAYLLLTTTALGALVNNANYAFLLEWCRVGALVALGVAALTFKLEPVFWLAGISGAVSVAALSWLQFGTANATTAASEHGAEA